MSARIVSVNVGRPQEWAWAGLGRSSIDKHAVAGPVLVTSLGLDGDQVTATPAQLHKFSEDSGVALFNYLKASLLDN